MDYRKWCYLFYVIIFCETVLLAGVSFDYDKCKSKAIDTGLQIKYLQEGAR